MSGLGSENVRFEGLGFGGIQGIYVLGDRLRLG